MRKNWNIAISGALLLGALTSTLSSNIAHALTETERILSKKYRKLKPPPKSLLAHRYSAENRYDLAWKRTIARTSQNEALTTSTKSPASRENNVLSTSPNRPVPVQNNYAQQSSQPYPYEVAPYYGNSNSSSQANYSSSQASFQRKSINDSFVSLGVVGAGVYGVIGFEVDIRLGDWNIGGGIGTGYDYRSWGVRGRYYMGDSKWTPYIDIGYAHWSLSDEPKDNKPGFPGYLTKRFFSNDDATDIKNKNVNLVYPGIGIMYMGPYHFAVSAEAQYLVHLKDFQGGLIGSLGLVKFF